MGTLDILRGGVLVSQWVVGFLIKKLAFIIIKIF